MIGELTEFLALEGLPKNYVILSSTVGTIRELKVQTVLIRNGNS